MPDQFSKSQLQEISTSLYDLCVKHEIPFVVLSIGTSDGSKKVITLTGAPDPEIMLFKIKIEVSKYK